MSALAILLAVLGSAALGMSAAFLYARSRRNMGYVDVFWTLGMALSAATVAALAAGDPLVRVLVAAFGGLWGLGFGSHVLNRVKFNFTGLRCVPRGAKRSAKQEAIFSLKVQPEARDPRSRSLQDDQDDGFSVSQRSPRSRVEADARRPGVSRHSVHSNANRAAANVSKSPTVSPTWLFGPRATCS
jgi:hypothetical protein